MAMRIGIGLSRLKDAYAAGRAAVREAKRSVPHPDLAVVFGSVHFDQHRLHEGLCSELDPNIMLGGSSDGEISNAGVSTGSVVVLLVSLPGCRVSMFDSELEEKAGDTARSVLARFPKARPEPGPDRIPCGLLWTGHHKDFQDNRILKAIRDVRPDLPVFGGQTTMDYDRAGLSDPDFWSTHQYQGGRLSRKSMRLAVWDIPKEGHRLAYAFEHGWSPVGPLQKVTRAEGAKIYEIDGVPIFDFYRQFLGKDLPRDFFESMVQRFGLSLMVRDGERKSFLLKAPVSCDFNDGGITFAPPEDMAGRKVQLIQANRQGLLEGARQAALRCKEALGGLEPALVLVVSCCTRRAILNTRCGTEAEIVREVFGRKVPFMGYYAGGEIFPFLNRYEEVIDPARPLWGSHFHAGTIGFLAIGAERRAEAVNFPPEASGGLAELDEPSLRGLMVKTENAFDDMEKFMVNLSRKSYRDGEQLREQNGLLSLKNEHNEKLQAVVHRYTPHDIWTKLGDNVARGIYELADDEAHFTFMFMDVKGFTSFSEKHGAKVVVSALNRIFKPATDIIYECGGDVDKYIGDCIFAVYPSPDQALTAAQRILLLLKEYEAEADHFSVRIGINSGRAVRANVGSGERREYTYIGDAVNVAQRLEANCTPNKILISAQAYDGASVRFREAERKEIMAKGKSVPIPAYELTPGVK